MLNKLRKMLKFPLVRRPQAEGAASGPWSAGSAGRSSESVGALLRTTRLETGLDVRQVAASLRIRVVFLQAIEAGRYEELPGIPYAVGFIRSYAEFLELDADFLVTRFKEEVSGAPGRQALYFPSPLPEAHIPGGTMLLVALVLGGFVYGGWYVLTATDRSMVDVVPTLPQRLLSFLDVMNPGKPPAVPPAPKAGTVVGTKDAASSAAVAATAAATAAAAAVIHTPLAESGSGMPGPGGAGTGGAGTGDLPGGAVPPSPPVAGIFLSPTASSPTDPGVVSPQAAAPQTAAVATVDDPEDETPLVSGPADDWENGHPTVVPMTPRGKPAPPALPTPGGTPSPILTPGPIPGNEGASVVPDPSRVTGGPARESRLHIRARQETWVQIRDLNGEVIFAGVLKAGDVYRVPERGGLRLSTGNAGGLSASMDGAEGALLGGTGQVLQDIPLEALRTIRGR